MLVNQASFSFRHALSLCVSIVSLLVFPAGLQAQQALSFSSAQTVFAGSLNQPLGVATDTSNNLYVADTNNQRVLKYTAGVASVLPFTGLSLPVDVAVDGMGNIYVLDTGTEQVVELTSAGAQTTLFTGISKPVAIAADQAGRVFVADYDGGQVLEFTPGSFPVAVPFIGLLQPTGIAVSPTNDDVYVTQAGTSEIWVSRGAVNVQTVLSIPGLVKPAGLTTSNQGLLWIADSATGNLYKVSNQGGTPTTVATGLSSPGHLASDLKGNIFVANAGNNQILEEQTLTLNFGSVNVCSSGQSTPAPCSATVTLNFNANSSTELAAAPTVVTQGAPNLDYTLGSSTCTGTMAAGSTCTVTVNFAPLQPGVRMGAVQIQDSVGNLIATTFLRGLGQGPAVAFNSSSWIDLPFTQLAGVNGIAVDAKGNVYVSDEADELVAELQAGGGPQITVLNSTVPGATGLQPGGIGIDGAGNVYIANSAGPAFEIPANGGAPIAINELGNAFGIAVDGEGNVFAAVGGFNYHAIVELSSISGPQILTTAVGSPSGVAVDAVGNVYYSDLETRTVLEMRTSGGAPVTVVQAEGVNYPFGLAVDAANNLYVADGFSGIVEEVPAGGGTPIVMTTGGIPQSVAIDSTGNIFVAVSGQSVAKELVRTQPPAMTFAASAIGTPSSDSPQSFTVQNTGNQLLAAVTPGFTLGSDSFQQVSGPGTPDDCTSTFQLAPGASCNVSISFIPQTANGVSTTETFTDNNRNASAAVQTGSLQGGGAAAATSIVINAPSYPYGTNGAVTVSVSSSGGTVTGTVSLAVDSATPQNLTLLNGSATFTMVNLSIGQHVLTANFAAQNDFSSSTTTGTVVVEPALPTVTFTGAPATALIGAQFTVAATTNASTTAKITVSGSCSIAGNVVTITDTTASCLMTANWDADANYQAAKLTQTTTPISNSPKVTFTGAPATAAYQSTFTVFTSTNGTTAATIAASGACSVTGTTVTMTSGSGICQLTATWAPDKTFSGATATQSTNAAKISPTVTFTGAPATAAYQSSFVVNATTNSSSRATIAASGACSAAGTTVTITAMSGTCSLTASWAADANYLPASAPQSTVVTGNLPAVTISWPAPAAITYGTALSSMQLDATASYNGSKVAGTFVYTPAKGTVLNAGTQSLSVTFTPTNLKLYSVTMSTVSLQVNQATPKITWNKLAAIVYGTPLSSTQLDATASVPGTLTYSPAAGTVLGAGTQTLTVTFTPTDSTDYADASGSVALNVTKAAPQISWPTPAPISYGTALSSTQLNATASVPGTFTYSPAAGAVLVQGVHTLTATFTPADLSDYTTAKATVSLQVTQSMPTINWPTPAPITYGQALSATQLNATATYNGLKVAGTFVYTPSKGTILHAGVQTLTVVFTPSNTSNYSSVVATVSLQVNQALPKITWAKPTAITSTTPLSSTQLDATSTVAGTFVFSPAAGTTLPAGTHTLSVLFTPSDSTDYLSQSATTTINVKP